MLKLFFIEINLKIYIFCFDLKHNKTPHKLTSILMKIAIITEKARENIKMTEKPNLLKKAAYLNNAIVV